MADAKVVRLQEPYPARISDAAPGTDAAPIHDGIVTNGAAPAGEHARCTKCGGGTLHPTYHRDLMDCIGRGGELRGGEHLHWVCSECGYDFTTKCLKGGPVE